MHVALYSPAWPLKRYPNGVVTYVHWMREELLRLGHRVSIFTTLLDEPEADVHPVRGSLGQRVGSWLRGREDFAERHILGWGRRLAATVLRVHRRTPIDVFEMEESFGWMADVQEMTSIPTVVKLHGPAFLSLVEDELETPLARARIAREGRALMRMACVTSPAQRTLDETIARYDLKPALARHIDNPLSLPPSAPVWALDRCDRKRLLFVGRFDKRKGGDVVLRAFEALAGVDPSLQLTFVGPDGGVADSQGRRLGFDEARSILCPAAGSRVDYRGGLDPQQIYPLRANAYLTIVASRWENQSYTALEAMAQGCPLVSSDAGGQGEFVVDGSTGLLAKAGSDEELRQRIATLLLDPHRAASLGQRARELALTQHSPATVVAKTLEAYEAAIGMSRSR
ncbi:MAG TPA: glycosyltransferase family 4 protein [Caldimonas sp.]|nr:glycosyltransferase family 4 protein [Caldimonas sp.]